MGLHGLVAGLGAASLAVATALSGALEPGSGSVLLAEGFVPN